MVRIRTAVETDAAGIVEVDRPYVEVHPRRFEVEESPVAEMQRRIREVTRTYPWLVALDDEGPLGHAYGTRFRRHPAYDWTVETAVHVHPRAQKLGVGKLLYTELFADLAAQGFVLAVAGVPLPDAPSRKLHLALGFDRVGVLDHVGFAHGSWRPVEWWSRLVRDAPAQPEPTRPPVPR